MKTKAKTYNPEEQLILFRRFASWPKEDKRKYLERLPAHEVRQYVYTWQAWARGDQLAPEGSWSTWVVKAGRGWGKTRTGAEYIIEKARMYPGCHIALVGRTVADVRDVMVAGISGILSVSSPLFMPTYYPSKRSVIWPNGTRATTYSADEPDQLRGPQHSFAWCLAGDTPILMAGGSQKRIADIRIGDFVMTRRGPRKVLGHCLTKRKTRVYRLRTMGRQVVIGTAEHPVWVQGRGFVPISQLSKGMSLLCAAHVSSGMVLSGISDQAKTTMNGVSCFIGPYGNRLMAQSLKGIIFIIKMAIKQIIDLRILNCLLMAIIADCILKRNWVHIARSRWKRHWPQGSKIARSDWSECLSVHGAEASIIARQRTPCVSVRRSVLMRLDQELLLARHDSASFAQKSILQQSERKSTAQRNAIIVRPNNEFPLLNRFCVLSANKHSSQSGQMPAFVPENVPLLFTTTIDSVVRLATRYDVYDITIEDAHEFFAHGILVHNCDERASWQYDDAFDQLSFGLRISPAPGIDPQCIVTTTPRNTKAMKALLADPSTVVTNGKTYDNEENLSPRFIREIERRYSGTRLGLQEIEGEVVDDIEGALWKRKWIDDGRVVKHPELKRIVVAVDPPASSKETNKTAEGPAECGIVVAGLGIDDHGYVLADCSITGTPDEWSSEVLAAYVKFKADLIVGEVNNGGEMVGHTIKTAAKMAGMGHVPYEAIHASRGKQIRAEPVSTLYKNLHVHHVGVMADLEFQQCNWVPGEKSPDRLDGAVWAITKLMLPEGKGGGVTVLTSKEDFLPASNWQEFMDQQMEW